MKSYDDILENERVMLKESGLRDEDMTPIQDMFVDDLDYITYNDMP